MDQQIEETTLTTNSSRCQDEVCVPQAPQQFSQSTLGASTPRHEYQPFVVPSDISSVSDDSVSTECSNSRKRICLQPLVSTPKRNVFVSNRRLLLSGKSLSIESPTSINSIVSCFAASDSSASEDEADLHVRKKFKHATKGRDWALYKPKYDNRIYTYVVQNPENGLNEAKKWMNSYMNDSPSHAITAFLQCIVDICGFPQFNLTSKFNYKEENYVEIMHFMEKHPPYIQQQGNYLMRGTSQWCQQAHYGVFSFLKNVIQLAHENQALYDCVFIRYLVGFPVVLTKSMNRSMFHTGISFVIKIYTSLLHISKENEHRTFRRNDSTIDILNTIIKNMQIVISKACTINDASLSSVRVLFCTEVLKWFKKDPMCINQTKFFRKLLAFVCDPSQRVRRAALSTCHKLVENTKLKKYMVDYMKEFAVTIGGRLRDVDVTVVITAIQIYNSMLKTYPEYINDKFRNEIVRLIYYNYYNLAVAAGRFVMEMIELSNSQNLPIQQIVRIYVATQTENCAPVFVEALLPNCHELQQWHDIINILLSNDLPDLEEIALVEIFCQAVKQSITGKSEFCRIKAPRRNVKCSNTKNVTKVTLLHLPRLLVKFSNETCCVESLIELLLIVDFDHMCAIQHTNSMIQTVNFIIKKYMGTNNPKLLEPISKTLARFLDDHCFVKSKVEDSIMYFLETVSGIFLKCIEDLSEVDELQEDQASQIESSFLKLSVLCVDHDLTMLISYDNFAVNWSNLECILPSKDMDFLVKIACWHLIWQLREIIENGSKAEPANELQQEIKKLMTHCNKYLHNCLKLIKDSSQVQEMVFQCICNILLKFYDIENSVRSNQALKGLIPTFNESSQNQFMDFALGLLFNNTIKQPLKIRRTYLGNVISIIFLGAINILELSKIYVYYNLYYEAYGDILTIGLQKLFDDCSYNTVGLILLSLSYHYEKIIAYVPSLTMENEFCISLSKLALQFQFFIKKHSAELISILKMGINYSFASENNYAFLHFIKCYASPLTTAEKKLILTYFNEHLSEDNKNHEACLSFIAHLKKKGPEKSSVKDKSKSFLSGTTTITSIEIPESDDLNDIDTDYAISDFSDQN